MDVLACIFAKDTLEHHAVKCDGRIRPCPRCHKPLCETHIMNALENCAEYLAVLYRCLQPA